MEEGKADRGGEQLAEGERTLLVAGRLRRVDGGGSGMSRGWAIAATGGLASFAMALALVPAARRAALRWGITDRPGVGKVHRSPVPYLGGVAVAAAVLTTAVPGGGWRVEAVALAVAALLVATVGLLDDLRTVRPSYRVAVEVVAASVAFGAGARVHVFGGPADWALTVAWLVVLTNAYNLLDNMDGCVASITIASTGGVLGLAVLGDQVLVGALAAALLGASAGFLVYNRAPASVFLGDAGSLFIGFLLSAAALELKFPVRHEAGAVAVALIAAPALFDTILVVVSRLATRRPIYVGGRDHTSHRLALLGLPAAWIAPTLALVAALCAALGVAVGRGLVDPQVAIPVAACAAVALGFLLRLPVYEVPGASRGVPASSGGVGVTPVPESAHARPGGVS